MSKFSELERITQLAKLKIPNVSSKVIAEVKSSDGTFPIHSFVIGSQDKSHPTFGLFAGVHGLEKIGTHVALNHLESFVQQLSWDSELQERMRRCRLVSVPMVNPWGVFHYRRSNSNGVDLMRNAPIEATSEAPFLLGGHRISSRLPWYRGEANAKMEVESQALADFVREEMFESEYSCSVDVHSGFGSRDRLWHPYAKSDDDFPLLDKALMYKKLFDNSFPNHVYLIEPQSASYKTHGDMWDYLFDEHYAKFKGRKVYIPWSLEMGSWVWVKKNPLQIFSALGAFNPIKPHRYKRIMRRHYFLLDFFLRSTANYKNWI